MKKIFKAFFAIGLIANMAQAVEIDVIQKVVNTRSGVEISETFAVGSKGAYAIYCYGFLGDVAQLRINSSMTLENLSSNVINMDISLRTRIVIAEKKMADNKECRQLQLALESAGTHSRTLTINSPTSFDLR